MTGLKLSNQHDRMRRVLDHIDRHLDEDLSLDALSGVAAFSKHHFHRQFTASVGLPVHRYVQLARFRRASRRLALAPSASVTDAALEAGYDAPDAFARAFRRRLGQLPSAFRSSPDWAPWLAAFEPFTQARSKLMTATYSADAVTVRQVPPTPVALIEHRGDPATIHATIQRFVGWRRANGLGPASATTFTVFHTDPRTTPPAEHRVDLCVGTTRAVASPADDVVEGLIPGGRCAVLRVTGTAENLEQAALFLYRDWLPASGEEPRDFPLYCQRVRFFPEVPEHEGITDLFLPLQ